MLSVTEARSTQGSHFIKKSPLLLFVLPVRVMRDEEPRKNRAAVSALTCYGFEASDGFA